jgi:DNA sulfur modification protein DndD
MKFERIKLRNFRPYRDVEVDFTLSDGQIHIIEGPQGAGKTSFHKAIQWGLYGDSEYDNFRQNWNATAREEDEREMFVEIKFTEDNIDHLLRREISSFNPDLERAYEDLKLVIDGENRYEDERAQDEINELLPEQLKEFFFLDGERIRKLIDDETGRKVKEDIETILKHQAIIHAKEDLEYVIDNKYESELERAREEKSEREELNQEYKEIRDEIAELERQRDELRDERGEKKRTLEQTREELEKYDDELAEQLQSREDNIADLKADKASELDDLRDAWTQLPYAILEDTINEILNDLEERVDDLIDLRSSVHKQEIVQDLQQEALDGRCPICGDEHVETVPEVHANDGEDVKSEASLTDQIHSLRQRINTLNSASPPDRIPGEVMGEIQRLRNEIRKEEEKRQELMEEFGGRPTDAEGQKQRYKENINRLESRLDEIQDELDEKAEKIKELQSERDRIQREKQKKSGQKTIDDTIEKIEAAEQAIGHLDGIREAHIEQKREAIKRKMDKVFNQVSQSEFIKGRYKGIDFAGDAEDEDSFVLELVKNDGSKKAMNDHPPSAGETQLTALSFIFGLNEYAKYSTTIVFDTVAGRLDLDNSRAQGQFFTTLEEPIVLLVTDAELQQLEQSISGHTGVHYVIKPDKNMDSEMELVGQ